MSKESNRWRAYQKAKRLLEQSYAGNSDWHDRQFQKALSIEIAYGGFDNERLSEEGVHIISKKDENEVAWAIVRRENMEIRESHPKVYRWARAYIDSTKE